MAMPLEETIMREIGLGANYNWFNGSGSCRYIRQTAADKLASVIQKHQEAGEEIAAPDNHLVAVLKRVAQIGDESDYSLTRTWQAASYVIAEHIRQAKSTDQDKLAGYENLKSYIEQNYFGRSNR